MAGGGWRDRSGLTMQGWWAMRKMVSCMRDVTILAFCTARCGCWVGRQAGGRPAGNMESCQEAVSIVPTEGWQWGRVGTGQVRRINQKVGTCGTRAQEN